MKHERGVCSAVRAALVVALLALLAGCGWGASTSEPEPATGQPTDGIPRLDFGYDASAPLDYHDQGVDPRSDPIAVHDISFRSGGLQVEGLLLQPPGSERRPAVIFVAGGGSTRTDLMKEAGWLAARNVVTLAITAPSTSVTTSPRTGDALLAQARSLTVNDVVAVRRAVDVLQALPAVDASRIGYVGWSLGAKTGIFVATAEPRVKALVLLSAGADPLSAFVANAPPNLQAKARQILGSVDPIRYIAWVKPDAVLLENGRQDEVVPEQALLNITRAAPDGTEVRWYRARHALNATAYQEAFDWLAEKLPIDGPPVAGATTGPR
jgi:dienelactone hydrolase